MLNYPSKVVRIVFGDVNTTKIVVIGGGGSGSWLLIRVEVKTCWPTGVEVLQKAADEAGD